MINLYRAWSIVDNFQGHDQVRLNWFVASRRDPVAPFPELIIDYDAEDKEIMFDQIFVKELLTESELKELRDYIRQVHNNELFVEQIELPVRRGHLSYGLIMMSGIGDFYFLAEEKGYSLSVPILAHYDLSQSPLSVQPAPTDDSDVSPGIEFLQLVFREIEVPSPDRKTLQALTEKISRQHNLYVQKRENKDTL